MWHEEGICVYIESNADHNSTEVADVYWFIPVENLSQNICLDVVFFINVKLTALCFDYIQFNKNDYHATLLQILVGSLKLN